MDKGWIIISNRKPLERRESKQALFIKRGLRVARVAATRIGYAVLAAAIAFSILGGLEWLVDELLHYLHW